MGLRWVIYTVGIGFRGLIGPSERTFWRGQREEVLATIMRGRVVRNAGKAGVSNQKTSPAMATFVLCSSCGRISQKTQET
jgi:hypothetical protein